MQYIILEERDVVNYNTTYEYDEIGDPIPGTESTYSTKTTITTVEFTFPDSKKITIDIPHFAPQSEDDILKGISNRYITELKKSKEDN